MANAGVAASAPPRKSAAIEKAKAFGNDVRIGASFGQRGRRSVFNRFR
jgi:hypothetical protein